jgi:hypothetical protein
MIFAEAIGQLGRRVPLSEYIYFGLGGPFLEDFRLLYEHYPMLRLVSIEGDVDVLKRQRFHVPCRTIRLEHADLNSYISQHDPRDQRSIFWLDYTTLEYANFSGFEMLLGKVPADSMVKITLRAKWTDYRDASTHESFRAKFGAIMPDQNANPPSNSRDFVKLIQDMVQIASQRALPSAMPLRFQPVCSFFYSDGTEMLTVTGLVCRRSDRQAIRASFKPWSHSSLNWAHPKRIAVPVLTTKERLYLQDRLPCARRSGRTLRRALGYLVDENRPRSERTLEQYARFHRYAPYFMRAIP